MADIIVCGSLHLDVMVRAPRLPGLDETLPGTGWGQQCGGKGGNQAVMAARLGAATAMIGRVGQDDFGQRLLSHLAAAGVDTAGVGIDPQAGSGMSVAIVDAAGDYGAVIVSGSNLAIPPDGLAAAWRDLGGARLLVLQNEVPEAVNIAAAQAAHADGAVVLLNAAPARALSGDLLNLVDILVVNRVEAEMMAGLAVADPDAALAVLPVLGADRRAVIITLGGAGLVGASAGARPFVVMPHPVTVASTHGAGDCFIGALSARLVAGATLKAACRYANLAAALFVGSDEEARARFSPHHPSLVAALSREA